jgi:ATP-dependent Clp protease adaptor protein ClpS
MKTKTKKSSDPEKISESHCILVFNDDINPFSHVIECFVNILKYDYSQAEQCAIIIHNNGKYAVKLGDFEYLEPYCYRLVDKGLDAVITQRP